MELESALNVSERSFMQQVSNSVEKLRGPITFTASDILGAYVEEYNANNANNRREGA